MRIQHNIAALNSYRNLTGNNGAVSKNLEKLSSGYRINRAGDDAAGLAISEKMRAQITGLKTAQKNANDGISLVQTAEGALTEVHSMLNRMVELADQSANGTYDNDVDRANIQKEMDSLKSEIDRISEGTNYNGINLLDGSLGGGSAAGVKSVNISNALVTVTAPVAGKYTTGAVSAAATWSNLQDGKSVSINISFKENADSAARNVELSFTGTKDESGNEFIIGSSGKKYAKPTTWDQTAFNDILNKELNNTVLADKFNTTIGTGGAIVFEASEKGSSGAVIESVSQTKYGKDGASLETGNSTSISVTTTTAAADRFKTIKMADTGAKGVKVYNGTNLEEATFSINGQKFVLANSGQDVSGITDKNITILSAASGADGKFTSKHAEIISQKTGLDVSFASDTLTFKPSKGTAGTGGLTLQIGDTAESFNQLTVSVGNMSSSALGIGSIDVSTQSGAKTAVEIIKTAINKVSSTRGDLGAIQNRLEHTINNLGVTEENMTAAESRIRDVDMADEMMNYTKNNILVQASQAMLAQANQIPQGVLQLLQ